MTSIEDLRREFTKQELLEIAELLDVDTGGTKDDIIRNLLDDVVGNGIPDAEDGDDLLIDFLHVGGFTDEDGNVIVKEDVDGGVSKENEENGKPDCYGYEDENDPACKRCSLKGGCMKLRMETCPECFGILWDPNEEECKICIEFADCMGEMNEKGD